MSKNNIHRIFFAVLALVVASLSCVSAPGGASPGDTSPDGLQEAGQFACDGTAYLIVTGEITSQGTNQFGTRGCEYVLKIRNNDPERAINFYIYQHEKDGYAHTEKSHWMGNILVEPGQVGTWTGSIYIYTDPDADGPVMSISEKIAGVYNLPECAQKRQDEKFFEQVSIPLDPMCPVE